MREEWGQQYLQFCLTAEIVKKVTAYFLNESGLIIRILLCALTKRLIESGVIKDVDYFDSIGISAVGVHKPTQVFVLAVPLTFGYFKRKIIGLPYLLNYVRLGRNPILSFHSFSPLLDHLPKVPFHLFGKSENHRIFRLGVFADDGIGSLSVHLVHLHQRVDKAFTVDSHAVFVTEK